MKLSGIHVALATPFHDDGEISTHKLAANLEKLNGTALSGYVASGSTGESVLLTKDEKLKLWQAVAESAAPEKLLIAGTAAESVRETIDMTNRAAGLGYKFALIRNPHYYKGQMARNECQLTYFRSVADAARIPVLIYNFPQVTGLDLPVDLIAKLAEHPNIIGIKDSSGNVDKVAQLAAATPAGFQILVGAAQTTYQSLVSGAVGAILAFANVAPEACLDIYRAVEAGDHAAAQRAQRHIATAALVVVGKHSIPGVKYGMDLKGYYGGPVRMPLIPLMPAAKTEIDTVLAGV